MIFDLPGRVMQRLRALFGRRGLESDMQAEMQVHFERAVERLMARGLSLADARIEARREFGNVAVIQEEARDAHGGRWLEAFTADVRFAFRYFARHRATVTIIVVVLALATGANTMLFSMFQAEFLRPAPGVEYDPAAARIWAQERPTRTGSWQTRGFTYQEFRALAARSDVFRELAAYTTQDVVLGGRDGTEARAVTAQFVTSNYFPLLRVRLEAGQGFSRLADDVAVVERTAVMSHKMATLLYGDSASAIGRSILINEVPLRIVGVAPLQFQGAMRSMGDPAVWIPVSARAEIAGASPRWLWESATLFPFGRLAAGTSRDQATAIAEQVVTRTLPDSAGRVGMARTAEVAAMNAVPPGPSRLNTIMMFVVLGTIGALILVVGWMNVSSLMVASAVGRRQEIAVRLSLGASRSRVLRQLVTESTIISLAGGTVGLLMAAAVLIWLAKRNIAGLDVSPDVGTFAFAMVIAAGTGILFGLSPALHATRGAVGTAMRESGAGSTSRSRLQRAFVAAQIAFSQPLLVLLGTLLGLVINSYKLNVPELSRHVIAVDVRPLPRSGAWDEVSQAVDSLIPRIAEHPNVVGVTPEATGFDAGWIVAPAKGSSQPDAGERHIVSLLGVAPGWFALADLPIVLGRDVSHADTTGTAAVPVVIGTDLAKTLWGDANPIGRTLASPELRSMDDDHRVMTVIGVYDASRGIPKMSGGADMKKGEYRIYSARERRWRTDRILVRTRDVASTFVPDLRELMRAHAPSLPITAMRTLEEMDEAGYRDSLQIAGLASAGGVLALLLASLGLYGVISLAVQQRTREIGIRIAIGANPARVRTMFLRSGVRLGAIALLLGLPISIAALRLALNQGLIMGPDVNVWAIGFGISVVLLSVAAAATWVPARRASRVDPAIALRVE